MGLIISFVAGSLTTLLIFLFINGARKNEEEMEIFLEGIESGKQESKKRITKELYDAYQNVEDLEDVSNIQYNKAIDKALAIVNKYK